jgi:FAD/FMN-containing dehydrogenase
VNDVLADVLLRPDDHGFAVRCSGWNSRVVHRPDYIVVAQTPEHVQQAVRFAARQRLSIYVQSTGHGALVACEGACRGFAYLSSGSSRTG